NNFVIWQRRVATSCSAPAALTSTTQRRPATNASRPAAAPPSTAIIAGMRSSAAVTPASRRTRPTCAWRSRCWRRKSMTPPKTRGRPEQALAAAAVRHAGEYYVPIEHHNPMELYAATAVYEVNGKLTVYDKTQGVQNVQRYLCGVFSMKPEDVRVMNPFMGGG